MSEPSKGMVSKLVSVLMVIVGAVAYLLLDEAGSSAPSSGADGAAVVAEAFRDQRSGVEVELEATVIKSLPDDNEGSRHQRFLVETETGQTLLVAHNIDLAPRVPLREGDRVRLRGDYEWNDRGGVIHWTHHDPQGRREGGFVEHQGRSYR